jgi:hypothetical protein
VTPADQGVIDLVASAAVWQRIEDVDDCPTEKARNLGKTQVCRGYRPRNCYYTEKQNLLGHQKIGFVLQPTKNGSPNR